jgi:hypothetical protein
MLIVLVFWSPFSLYGQSNTAQDIILDSCVRICKSDMIKRGLDPNKYSVRINYNTLVVDSLKNIYPYMVDNFWMYKKIKHKFVDKKFFQIVFVIEKEMDAIMMYFIDCSAGEIIHIGSPNLPSYK